MMASSKSLALRAINSHRECFLGDETFSKFAEGTAFAGARLREAFGFLDGRQSFLIGWVLAKLVFGRVDGFGEWCAPEYQADHEGKCPRAERATRMSMSNGGKIAGSCKDI